MTGGIWKDRLLGPVADGTLVVVHLLVGMGAAAGGVAAMTNPTNPLGVPVELLKGSPFQDFFLPGIFLFVMLGMGNLDALFLGFLKPAFRGYAGFLLGGLLVVWILIQCWMLQAVASLHVLFFVIGVLQGLLGLWILVRDRRYPFRCQAL
ncbi:hypothetical protein [Anaerotalea alkaliphila]|uniref:Uncharacterized protein n=1 Tax=Anaerotalea alkaliphila TaxID=2662126 RepID=A0A7X5HUN5_9FIRM|nr:hypothetical protein [Anaerotalea alkaliphila]NDL66973.1 hypothetical protein [Anaerotalea alkaliphila]